MKNWNNSKLALYLDKLFIANPVLNEHFYSKTGLGERKKIQSIQ